MVILRLLSTPLISNQVCLLQNTRFHAGDTKNDPAFAEALGKLAHVFVCDAFGVVHRDQGSVTVRVCMYV
jgi:3-phosphoglycerate kinase